MNDSTSDRSEAAAGGHSQSPQDFVPIICPHCGGDARAGTRCWLCGALLDVGGAPPIQLTTMDMLPSPLPAPPPPTRITFALSTMILIITLAAVCFGVLRQAPGLAIPLCVLLVPVFVRTFMVVRHREAAGKSVSAVEKIGLFTGSFAVATILATVVSVAAFCAFCGVCLVIFSADSHYGGGGMFLTGLGMCALAAPFIYGIVKVVQWIRRRYRRDIEK